MLKLDGHDFTTGRTRFYDQNPTGDEEPTAKIYVPVRLGDVDAFAQVDTGAAWSIMDGDTAQTIGVVDDGMGWRSVRTLVGTLEGFLARVPVTLLAEEGESLVFESTFLVVPENWPAGKIFLGYGGLLEHLRMALDPPANHFYFGESGGRS